MLNWRGWLYNASLYSLLSIEGISMTNNRLYITLRYRRICKQIDTKFDSSCTYLTAAMEEVTDFWTTQSWAVQLKSILEVDVKIWGNITLMGSPKPNYEALLPSDNVYVTLWGLNHYQTPTWNCMNDSSEWVHIYSTSIFTYLFFLCEQARNATQLFSKQLNQHWRSTRSMPRPTVLLTCTSLTVEILVIFKRYRVHFWVSKDRCMLFSSLSTRETVLAVLGITWTN